MTTETLPAPTPATPLSLAAAYTDQTMPPLALGAAFIAYRTKHDISQQELARQTNITSGTLHHYESLIRELAPELQACLEAGRLTFKEARCLADIRDFPRQREIAEPFISGRMSSVYAEKLVKHAKASPHADVDTLITAVLSNAKAKTKALRIPVHSTRYPVDLNVLEAQVMALAGRLDAALVMEIPEYRRLRLGQAVSILYTKAHAALLKWQYTNHTNGNGHNGHEAPPKHTSESLKATP